MNEKNTKMYNNGMIMLDARFFNMYQEMIDCYFHDNCISPNLLTTYTFQAIF